MQRHQGATSGRGNAQSAWDEFKPFQKENKHTRARDSARASVTGDGAASTDIDTRSGLCLVDCVPLSPLAMLTKCTHSFLTNCTRSILTICMRSIVRGSRRAVKTAEYPLTLILGLASGLGNLVCSRVVVCSRYRLQFAKSALPTIVCPTKQYTQ